MWKVFGTATVSFPHCTVAHMGKQGTVLSEIGRKVSARLRTFGSLYREFRKYGYKVASSVGDTDFRVPAFQTFKSHS